MKIMKNISNYSIDNKKETLNKSFEIQPKIRFHKNMNNSLVEGVRANPAQTWTRLKGIVTNW